MMKDEFKKCSERVEECLKERKDLVKELEVECKSLLKLEQEYRKESNRIILETDFKDLYKKDNEHIRNAHLQKEIPDKFDEIEIQKDIVKFIKMNITQIDKEIDFNNKKMSFIINMNIDDDNGW